MQLSACITTRNRTKELESCLKAIWHSTVTPYQVIVSDDSPDKEAQQQNRYITEKYPRTIYLRGPQIGVCGNRNNAVNAITNSEIYLVCFIDDDICVEPDFIAHALEQYRKMALEDKNRVILSGVSKYPDGYELKPGKLNFRGYFTSSVIPEAVTIHATIFPRKFFEKEQWDENIFFGYEDAELCLRALKSGYKIIFDPQLKVICGSQKSTLYTKVSNGLSNHQIYLEAARLYVGVKRYKYLYPNQLKLIIFLIIYFAHLFYYLVRKKGLNNLPEIIKRSNISKLKRLNEANLKKHHL